ncbi:hypothetical protein [Sphingomonas sp. CARO-RG-8B-R24-01]|uniref:hypothetical protein n=1 Tax=Sphingomonas sp. CARO-RG-8B-R24-01 TaxID=2914831 RepID=UPI001F5AF959
MQGERNSNGRIGRGASRCVLAACSLVATAPALASTQAGTTIANTATLTVAGDGSGAAQAIPSNTVTLKAAELLNVTIAADRPTIATRGTETVAVGFVVTNTGNGQEDYALAVTSGTAPVTVDRLAIDRDRDGAYSAAVDTPLAPGAALSLAPGETVRVFVLVDGSQVGTALEVRAGVTARTGSGAPATAFPGAGDGGSDAIVGATGATASATTQLVPTGGLPSLVKTQSVFAPDGSQRAIPGAIVTYRLVAGFVGATRGVVIDDPIPAGTLYVPGSLRLDEATLSDASDGDAGTATAAAIRVALGDMPGAGTRTIQFSVKIQ